MDIKTALMSEQVQFTNETFGNKLITKWDQKGIDKLTSQIHCIDEEFKELQKGFSNMKNAIARGDRDAFDDAIIEIRDATSDTLVTALGIPCLIGFDVESDMREVTKSNLSKVSIKFCDAVTTQEKYLKLGIKTYTEPCTTIPGFITKVLGDQYDNTPKKKFYPNGKFLKCAVSFAPPVFD